MQKKDYSHEVQRINSHTLRVTLVILGTLFVIIGVIGIFLPLLPTTPFMLLAAACYAKSSRRFYNWMMNNRVMGPIIREWRQYRAIPKRAKNTALVLLVVTFGISIYFAPIVWVKFLLVGMCITGLFFMSRIPVRELSEAEKVAVNADIARSNKSPVDQ